MTAPVDLLRERAKAPTAALGGTVEAFPGAGLFRPRRSRV